MQALKRLSVNENVWAVKSEFARLHFKHAVFKCTWLAQLFASIISFLPLKLHNSGCLQNLFHFSFMKSTTQLSRKHDTIEICPGVFKHSFDLLFHSDLTLMFLNVYSPQFSVDVQSSTTSASIITSLLQIWIDLCTYPLKWCSQMFWTCCNSAAHWLTDREI